MFLFQYVATKADFVIGVCTSRQMDNFRVDIGSSSPATISYLSFEGATKKNRPDVKVCCNLISTCILYGEGLRVEFNHLNHGVGYLLTRVKRQSGVVGRLLIATHHP